MEGIDAVMSPEPDERTPIIYVGRDEAGHWPVKDSGRRMEGCFVLRKATLSFAEAERQIHQARVKVTTMALVPVIPFGLVGPGDVPVSRTACRMSS